MIEEKFQVGLFEDARALRQQVFVEEEGYKNEFDEEDARAIHLVLYLDKKPIGVARLVEIDPETYRLGRVAVVKEFRHQKVGTYLVKYMEVKVKTLGGRKIILGAQADKVGFYAKLGYRPDPNGEVYLDEGHPHVMMEKILKFKKRSGPFRPY
jgi:Predicted acyltransferase